MPILVVLLVLALAGVAVWVKVLTTSDQSTPTVACNAPAASTDSAATSLGDEVAPTALEDVEPAAPSATRVRVFNANGQGGQAATVAAELSEYGFASAPDVQVGNDPVYVDQNMQCQGQIRFGENGLTAASTVALVAPCTELIQDSRTDDTVDLALGSYFKDLQPNPDAEAVLQALTSAPTASQPAPLDIDLLAAARLSRC